MFQRKTDRGNIREGSYLLILTHAIKHIKKVLQKSFLEENPKRLVISNFHHFRFFQHFFKLYLQLQ